MERQLFCRAAFLLVLAEAGLRIFSFRAVMHWAQRERRIRAARQTRPERVAWLVEAAARQSWPRPTCLRQSLVLYELLKQQGQDARLMIGTTMQRGDFQAHAWVEVDGREFGGEGQPRYAELVSFGGGRERKLA